MSRVETSGKTVAGTYGRPISPAFVGGLLRLLDLSIVGAIACGIYLIHVYPPSGVIDPHYVATIVAALLTSSILFQWFGVYSGDYLFSRRLHIDRILTAWAITCCVLLAIAFTLKISSFYSRLWTLSWFLSTFGALALSRMMLSYWIGNLASEGRFANRTVIVGAGSIGRRLASYLRSQGDLHTRLLGFVDDRLERVPRDCQGVEVLGDSEHLITLIRRNQVDQVFVALPWSAEARLHDLIHRLAMTPVTIRLAPDLVGFELRDRDFSSIAGLPMLHVFDRQISRWSQLVKALEDRVLAALLLLFVGPLLLLIALAVKLESPGPAFVRQQRRGFNDGTFEALRFRTMQAHADAPRVTRLGLLLRRSGLDQLPQLISVLKGEMSLVGPRPHERETEAAGLASSEVIDAYAARHRIKPGITGWAQVNGWGGERDSADMIQKRVECDLYYIDNWSVWFDIKILFKTGLILLGDEHAY